MRPARAAGPLSGVHSSPLIGGGEPDRIDAIDNGADTTSSGEVARPTVLVVDDDEEARVALARILATDGFEAITAVDGEAAIGRVASDPPAVVLLDRIMPGLDGIETLRRLKAIAPEVPAIIVTVLYGERGTGPLLILSQVILSLQLSFAVFPLVQFTSEKAKMGRFANKLWLKILAWIIAVFIALLNGYLLFQTISPILFPRS